ncbi:flagellar biosynthetic protein FliQ [Acidimicrobium ferrooxidans DSM 10331]|uniref:Flagellar biosynthetic protein FliQ n=1 Tax=Acidimicrobium ferrooxidans (strain DSM 10331 / JCM 15462 / NBRC 103882 / ICP) TaxID=525909 RepID=C7M227_ACIFD|nr:flagellar biosynthesis protein FliQ [Acidimicrobium ferrooxidans]ACU53125.1 flagellar biosynthetic protein FliQ [Acidimicrobium ferrooxidans DSM 10331]
MNDAAVLQIARTALEVATLVAGPVLAVALLVGLVVALAQTLTQIQEATLSFVPKLAAIALVLLFTGHWMLQELTTMTTQLYSQIPHLVQTL